MSENWDNSPFGGSSTEGVRAGATLRWLETSGPRYAEMDVVFRRVTDFVEVLVADWARIARFSPRQISHASWHMCAQAKPGDVLVLKLRCDDTSVRNAA